MTYGMSVANAASRVSKPNWTEGLTMSDKEKPVTGFEFVKNWKVVLATPGVGIPQGQGFMIYKVIEPGRVIFKIKAVGETNKIAKDWLEADLHLHEDKLVFHFEKVKTDWQLALQSNGSLTALGKWVADSEHDQPLEAPGEWVAQEE